MKTRVWLGVTVMLAVAGPATVQAEVWAPVSAPKAPKPPAPPSAPVSPGFKPYKGPSTYEHPAGEAPYQHGARPKPYGTSVFGPEEKKPKKKAPSGW